MAHDKKKRFPFILVDDGSTIDVTVDKPVEKVEEPVKKPITFERRNWRDVKVVFVCTECNQSRDYVDDIIEHILLHFKEPERLQELERLLKEK